MPISDDDLMFMDYALEEATHALHRNLIPVGAVLVRNAKVIAYGRKTGATHPLVDHAEHNACYQQLHDPEGRNLSGCTMYSTLEPCLMCMSMLMTTRVKRIVYGLPDPYGGGLFILKNKKYMTERFKVKTPRVVGGCRKEESRQLLRQFFESKTEGTWSDKNNVLVKLCCSQ